jgi:hypothetical protein
MKNLLPLLTALTLMPSSVMAVNLNNATEYSDKPHGATYNLSGGARGYFASMPGLNTHMRNMDAALRSQENKYVSQAFGGYGPQTQYHPPSFFQGAGGPVVVPPTVITTPGSIPRECRRKRITLALFFEVDSSDC